MSWSLPYTSQLGIVPDSYHRIAIDVALPNNKKKDPNLLIKLENLYREGIHHFYYDLRIPGNVDDLIDLTDLDSLLNEITNSSIISSDTFSTIQIPAVTLNESHSSFPHIEEVIRNNLINCVILSVSDSMDISRIMDILDNAQSTLKKTSEMYMKTNLKIGLNGIYDRDTLQLIFSRFQSMFQLANPGPLELPNLCTRNIDFIHGYGMNIFQVISQDELIGLNNKNIPTIVSTVGKYPIANKSVVSVLIKTLLQNGIIVCIDGNLPIDFFHKHVTFVCHPFIYRAIQQAPTTTKQFEVDKDDCNNFVQCSEEEEKVEDENWARFYLHTLESRKFSYQV